MKKFSLTSVLLVILLGASVALSVVKPFENIFYTFTDIIVAVVFIYAILMFIVRRVMGVREEAISYYSLPRMAVMGYLVKSVAVGYVVVKFNGWHLYEVLMLILGLFSLIFLVTTEVSIYRNKKGENA
ncbi:hypothetical protein [Bacillus phage phiAGATE]|uniref:Uncharacterized protein n=1 Tax=Bacillus phage phiAGATE TaxID=1204533 RepID=L0LC09_9CAUD|nr:hypothetical protein G380_gp060 [Bacillus phage phiAGATE]AGB62710.1 hypothetical protein [Bacillus phage phiAGATE]